MNKADQQWKMILFLSVQNMGTSCKVIKIKTDISKQVKFNRKDRDYVSLS